MPLTKLDNFIKNTEGRTIYVNPDDLDSSDSITNQGNSLARPFKTIQRALIEAARFSYIKGSNNDIIEKTTILLFPGEHLVDNRPGFAIYDNSGAAFAVSRTGGVGVLASSVLSLGLDSNFDLQQESNDLYKFNSFYGGVIIPRGVSIVGLDLRKTKIRPKYVPNPTDPNVSKSAIFRLTGTCYLWQFSVFDGNASSFVYTDEDDFSEVNQSVPNFSHHKLSCFEYADGVNNVGSYGLTDLDMYYSKVSNAFNAYRDIDQKYPASADGFAKMRPEWEIVGAFASDPITISNIIAGNGFTANSQVTVTTSEEHELSVGTPIKISGVSGSGITNPYNISTTVQNVINSTTFTYLLPSFSSYPTLNPSPSSSGAKVTIETDTVSGASPYIFNVSLRSVWGMNGLLADGAKAAGFRSTVLAQFTGISLQKDDRAFVKYNKESRSYESIPISTVRGSELPLGASSTDSEKIYHIDQFAIYRKGWETTHIEISNDGFSQLVSIFAIGFNKHFHALNGGDHSITNSNSNFGQLALVSTGFKKEAFNKDNHGYITSIVTPKAVEENEERIEWLSLDVGLTKQVGISSHIYIRGFGNEDSPPSSLTQGYRIGAKTNDKLYVVESGVEYSGNIQMCDNSVGVSTIALGTNVAVKEYTVTSGPTDNSFTIGSNNLLTGETVKINSNDGDLPENITPHVTYYVINNGDDNTIKLASSLTNAIQGTEVTVYGGTNLRIVSRVSDKESGDLGSPVQYDSVYSNWFIHLDPNNTIYTAFDTLGTETFGDSSDLSFVNRIVDGRSLDDKLYKVRVVIPKEIQDAKDPEAGFVLQDSSSTGARNDADFTRVSLASTDYGYQRNPRFIATCSESAGTVTVITELPHDLQAGETVKIVNVNSTTNPTANNTVGFNGRFEVVSTPNRNTFTYATTDVIGISHTTGTFQNDVNTRTVNLPRYEREDLKGNFYIYRNEVITPYIYNQQDGIYHLYVLNSSNYVTSEFTDYSYGQLPADLYPQLDRDNLNANPKASKTFAKRDPIGDVVTNDQKKSITRETIDLQSIRYGIGQTISSVDSSAGVSTISFSQNHGLSGIVTYSELAGGSGYNNGTFYNVKLYNDGTTDWNGATAKVSITGGSITNVDIISAGSGYSNDQELDFDTTQIGSGVGAGLTLSAAGISTSLNDVIQVTGDGFTDDAYYRIISIPSSNSVAIAKTSGDPTINANQYVSVTGPSFEIDSVSPYNPPPLGTTRIQTTQPHGLLAGNRVEIVTSNNESLGDFLVESVDGVRAFRISAELSVDVTGGYVFKHHYSSNLASSGVGAENFGVRQITLYDLEYFKLTTAIDVSTTSITFSSHTSYPELRLPLGSYIQIGGEILRILSTNNAGTATVLRGAFGTRAVAHSINSFIKKIKPLPIEFRRPSIIRASGHTFEYLGYGPGNYSTGLPNIQLRSLTETEEYLSQAQERSAGVVVYTGMNNRGDFYVGNNKKSSTTGEETTFDIPIPTVTGENASRLSVVFDEVTVKERLLVEGGASGQVLSQFDGPVTFNKNISFNSDTFMQRSVRLKEGVESTSITTGDLVVSGGVGIQKNLNVGGNFSVTGNVNVTGIATFTQGIQVPVGVGATFGNIEIGVTDDQTIDTSSGNLVLNADGLSHSLVAIQTNTTIAGILSVTDDITAFWSSDERLKDNIVPVNDGLDRVLTLGGYEFDWNEKSNKEGHDVGLIAQEIQEVLPEAVIERDNGYLAVDYHKVIPLLIESIKDLNVKVINLEKKLSEHDH